MPERAVKVATLIMECPMCASCIGAEIDTDAAEVEVRLQTISRVLELRREVSDCPRCGLKTIVFSLKGGPRSIRISGRV